MRILLAAIPLVLIAGCVSAPPPEPRPPAQTPPQPAAPPPVTAAASDWRDWPLTPGDWSYSPDARGSTARFGRAGSADLLLRCDRATRQVTLARRQGARTAPSLTIRTSSTARALAVQPTGDGQVVATLTATDSLLDAMGFSRGRFVIEHAGTPPLVIPAWAEILRVAEDCRG